MVWEEGVTQKSPLAGGFWVGGLRTPYRKEGRGNPPKGRSKEATWYATGKLLLGQRLGKGAIEGNLTGSLLLQGQELSTARGNSLAQSIGCVPEPLMLVGALKEGLQGRGMLPY